MNGISFSLDHILMLFLSNAYDMMLYRYLKKDTVSVLVHEEAYGMFLPE